MLQKVKLEQLHLVDNKLYKFSIEKEIINKSIEINMEEYEKSLVEIFKNLEYLSEKLSSNKTNFILSKKSIYKIFSYW